MAAISNGESNVFDANSLLLESEIDIYILMYILGLDVSNFSSLTIDNLISNIKNSYNYVSAENASALASIPNSASSKFLRTECNSLTRRARRAWFNMEFAKEVLENE